MSRRNLRNNKNTKLMSYKTYKVIWVRQFQKQLEVKIKL